MTAQQIVEYIGRGTHAARPVAPAIPAGGSAVYYETDTGLVYFWTGAAWALDPGGGVAQSIYASSNTTAATSSGVQGAGSLTFVGAGNISVGLSNSSIIVSGPTNLATSQGVTATGNTTGATSSETHALSALTLSGSGIVSVGMSNSSIIIAATTAAQTAAGLSLYASGNTTATTSSGVNQAGSLSFSGAGGVSVGLSNSIVVVSGATAGLSSGFYAVGNTAGSTTSQGTADSLTYSGGGIVSVGFFNSSVVISASQSAAGLSLYVGGNTTTSTSSGAIQAGSLSFDGAGAVSVGVSGSSVVISGRTADNIVIAGNTTAQSSSSVVTLGSLSISATGVLSAGMSAGALVLSVPAAAGSGTVGNAVALGNTTGATSSTTHTLTNLSFEGDGGVSVGFSTTAAGAGVVVISGATTAAQTAPTLSLYAVGNTTTSTSSGVIAAGSLSFDGAGAASVGISGSSVVISVPTAAASGTVQNLFALGNTTGATTSSTVTLSNISFEGDGGVSIGFSTTGAGAGVIVVSGATTAASGTARNMFALGNTTGATSSSTGTLTQVSYSGAGAASVGFSTTGAGAGVVVISAPAQTAAAMNAYATGNTTAATSSAALGAGSISFSGASGVSVGLSNSIVVISGGGGGAAAVTQSYYIWQTGATQNLALAKGTMIVAPIFLGSALSVDHVRFLVGVAPNNIASIGVSSSNVSVTGAATASEGTTYTVAIYSSSAPNNFGTVSTTTMSFGVTENYTVTLSSQSKSISVNVTYSWAQGSSSNSTFSTSSSVTTAAVVTFSTNLLSAIAATSSFGNTAGTVIYPFDVPMAASLPVGTYLVGIMYNSASGTTTNMSRITGVANWGWSAAAVINGLFTRDPNNGGALNYSMSSFGNNVAIDPYPGIGSTSSAGSALPGTINWSSLSRNGFIPIVQLGIW